MEEDRSWGSRINGNVTTADVVTLYLRVKETTNQRDLKMERGVPNRGTPIDRKQSALGKWIA